MNNITTITSFDEFKRLSQIGQNPYFSTQKTGNEATVPFANVLSEALNNVEELEAIKAQGDYDLAVGNIDDPTSLVVNAAKAELALNLFVQLRNKALEAYQETMRLSV